MLPEQLLSKRNCCFCGPYLAQRQGKWEAYELSGVISSVQDRRRRGLPPCMWWVFLLGRCELLVQRERRGGLALSAAQPVRRIQMNSVGSRSWAVCVWVRSSYRNTDVQCKVSQLLGGFLVLECVYMCVLKRIPSFITTSLKQGSLFSTLDKMNTSKGLPTEASGI